MIKNPRLMTVLFLGFSSGLPLAFTGTTLQAWFTQAGVDVLTIGTLSLLGLPYLWKFLWAPCMDRYTPPFFGRRRGWVMISQFSLVILLFCLSFQSPQFSPIRIGIMIFAIAFISASQDIVVDAYRTDVLKSQERGLGSALFILGYRIALLVSGGVALVMADYWGWQWTFQVMAFLMLCAMFLTLKAPDPLQTHAPKTFIAAIVEPIKDILSRDKVIFLILFIILYKLGDALALALMSNFLLKHLHFSLTDVGMVYKTAGLIATLLGAFLGGLLLVRMNLFSALILFGLLQAFSNVMFVFLALSSKDYLLMVSAITIESFCSGMSTAALVAYLMSLCHARYSATQYACFSALASLPRVFSGPVAAMMVSFFGWTYLFLWAFILSFPGLLVLTFLRHNVRSHAEVLT